MFYTRFMRLSEVLLSTEKEEFRAEFLMLTLVLHTLYSYRFSIIIVTLYNFGKKAYYLNTVSVYVVFDIPSKFHTIREKIWRIFTLFLKNSNSSTSPKTFYKMATLLGKLKTLFKYSISTKKSLHTNTHINSIFTPKVSTIVD